MDWLVIISLHLHVKHWCVCSVLVRRQSGGAAKQDYLLTVQGRLSIWTLIRQGSRDIHTLVHPASLFRPIWFSLIGDKGLKHMI